MNNDAGWCGSGGPWITPEQSMQVLTFSETAVEGPAQLEGELARPPAIMDFYRDVAVLAFPTPEDDGVVSANFSPRLTDSVNDPSAELARLNQSGTETVVKLPGRTPVILSGCRWSLQSRSRLEPYRSD